MTQSARPKDAPWITPCLTVQDVDHAMAFYQQAFGCKQRDTAKGDDGTTWHGELIYQDSLIMLGKEGAYECDNPTQAPVTSGTTPPIALYLYCDEVDHFYQHAVAAGAKGLQPPTDMFWGDRVCRLQDPNGYVWLFATHRGEA